MNGKYGQAPLDRLKTWMRMMILRRERITPLGYDFPSADFAAVYPRIGSDIARMVQLVICGSINLLQKLRVFVMRHGYVSLAPGTTLNFCPEG
jgi:hypothetical protein